MERIIKQNKTAMFPNSNNPKVRTKVSYFRTVLGLLPDLISNERFIISGSSASNMWPVYHN